MTKICTKCKKEYPATLDFFGLEKRVASGLLAQCRGCYRKYYWDNKQACLKRVKKNYQKQHKTIMGYLQHLFQVIKNRCTNINHVYYYCYGGRGIKLKFTSDEFVDYVMNVLKVDPRGLQIDRIDNNGNYEPGNIRFVTAKVNSNNRRQEKWLN